MKKVILPFLITVVLISCNKEVFTGINEPVHTETGIMYLTTTPAGYKVYMDNKVWGVITPDTVRWLTEGNHILTLKHEYFADSSLSIDINNSDVLKLNVDMISNHRFYAKALFTTSPSNAKIYLNDVYSGYSTPMTISDIYPGHYKVKFKQDNCWLDSAEYLLKGGVFNEISMTLEDTSRRVNYRINNSPISSIVLNKVVVDKNNNKWIGSIDNGIIKFDGKKWTTYSNTGVIEGSRINDLLVGSDGKIWVATVQGLFRYDGMNWTSFTSNLPESNVTALAEDFIGNIWIATSNTLVKYDKSSFKIFTSKSTGVPLNNLSSLSISKNGELWIGSYTAGIILYNGTNFLQYSNTNIGLDAGISYEIQDLIVDNDGNLYAFCMNDYGNHLRSAVIKYNGSIWEVINLPLSVYDSNIYSFYKDINNNIWMAGNKGLIKYNSITTPAIYEAGDLSLCSSFCIDLNGDGWITKLGGGLVKLKKGFF